MSEPEFVACHAPSGREDLHACVREQGHDSPHCFWSGVNVAGGRKSAIWLVEQQDDKSVKTLAHGDFEGRYEEDFAIFLVAMCDIAADREFKRMPEDERAEYERAKQSVIDARRSAERNEGQQWIG